MKAPTDNMCGKTTSILALYVNKKNKKKKLEGKIFLGGNVDSIKFVALTLNFCHYISKRQSPRKKKFEKK